MILNSQSFSLPFQISRRVETALQEWQVKDGVARLWAGDASLWTGGDEGQWLGWLTIVDEQLRAVDRFAGLSRDVRTAGFTHALMIGMGGSSLCPEVLKSIFGPVAGWPDLSVLDSTDPAQVRTALDGIDIERTIFIVASKSGTTLESRLLMDFFFEKSTAHVGMAAAGRHWIAITDPGSELEATAIDRDFRAVFAGRPSIGGRFSALSDFGMIPAACMGMDTAELLRRTAAMVRASGPETAAPRNRAIVLGIALGVAAEAGRDKLTLVTSPLLQSFGAWLEQLIAESTGKTGQGVIPVHGEELGAPDWYGDDRFFVYFRLSSAPDSDQDDRVAALEEAGYPVVRIEVGDVYDIGQEFFRWELATAAAGSFLGLNPFDQPDVEASKIAARTLTERYRVDGSPPQESPLYETANIKVFAEPRAVFQSGEDDLVHYLRTHLNRIEARDYFALQAYLEMNSACRNRLEEIRRSVGACKRVATSVGFGPRFLHSTGQAHKGGPNTGVFLQITGDDAQDLEVPGLGCTFGVVKAAQAAGDYSVLVERGRRILRVHLGPDIDQGLDMLRDAVREALAD